MTRDRRPDVNPIVGLDKLPLCELIVRLSPELMPPYHLAPLPELLEKAPGGNLRVTVSPPVRHAKTTTILNAFPYWLLRNPRLELFYLTFDLDFAQRNSRATRRLAQQCGIRLSEDHNTIKEWRTAAGGTCFFASLGQEIQGRGSDIAVFDDSLGWLDRNDMRKRDEADAAISFVTTRLNPGGSVFVVGSRSGRDDPIGRRQGGRARAWMHVAQPAIIDEGSANERALWPEVRSLEHLHEVRRELTEKGDVSVWQSQYQGEPIADEAGVFVGETDYEGQPPTERVVIGVDAAFSRGGSADWFAAVPMVEHLSLVYILDVVRHQRGTVEIISSLQALKERFPGCRLVSYVSGPEIGVYDLLHLEGIDIERMPARWNKNVRARKTAHAWNRGRVLVPKHAAWRTPFLARTHSFTGHGDEQDDEQDAMVAGYDALQVGRAAEGFGGGFLYGRACV